MALSDTLAQKDRLPPILALTFDATLGGWKQFVADATIADAAGYDLIVVVPLGTRSFGAVWKMIRDVAQRSDLGVEDDEFSLADEDQV